MLYLYYFPVLNYAFVFLVFVWRLQYVVKIFLCSACGSYALLVCLNWKAISLHFCCVWVFSLELCYLPMLWQLFIGLVFCACVCVWTLVLGWFGVCRFGVWWCLCVVSGTFVLLNFIFGRAMDFWLARYVIVFFSLWTLVFFVCLYVLFFLVDLEVEKGIMPVWRKLKYRSLHID